MKKLVSIGLLLVFLFNVIGYKVMFYYLEQAADNRIEARLEALSELDKDLITVKIPIKLPYQTDWDKFERTDGEVAVNGTVYRYVKQKVSRDTLILLCINYKEKSDLVKKRSEYFQKVNDLSAENNKKPSLKQAKTDYFQETDLILFNLYASEVKSPGVTYRGMCSSGFIRKEKLPPKLGITSIS